MGQQQYFKHLGIEESEYYTMQMANCEQLWDYGPHNTKTYSFAYSTTSQKTPKILEILNRNIESNENILLDRSNI